MCLSEIVLVITWESLPVKRKACLEKKTLKPKQDSYPVVLHTWFIRAASRAWMASASGTVSPF